MSKEHEEAKEDIELEKAKVDLFKYKADAAVVIVRDILACIVMIISVVMNLLAGRVPQMPTAADAIARSPGSGGGMDMAMMAAPPEVSWVASLFNVHTGWGMLTVIAIGVLVWPRIKKFFIKKDKK